MSTSREKKQQAFSRGIRAERLAAFALMLKGFRIVERRYKTRFGEIDLIARRGSLVLIVEVKARASVEAAMEAVSAMNLYRIESAADHWLARQPDHHKLSLRFDLIAVLPRCWPVHIPAAVSFRN
ncbi:YraN family protein [Pseudochrobactrum sp. Wa41.01b-1]|uniref:YraN family protein n=1 Tax=Pseudochrobactrum sp. Wa41.01b-1 TaxID=2864102 RepID=UPI001C6929BE|nr:YraN family protein [Pseudochrobactrum sp. Wa41.01b-1]QYM72152.1 YraN family protein [Pseudochrobactrum sp. Wa41.01b-1]